MSRADRGPGARGETIRAALRRELASAPATARELSAAVGLREKDVAGGDVRAYSRGKLRTR